MVVQRSAACGNEDDVIAVLFKQALAVSLHACVCRYVQGCDVEMNNKQADAQCN